MGVKLSYLVLIGKTKLKVCMSVIYNKMTVSLDKISNYATVISVANGGTR